jgi:hypothetical protein
MMVRSLSLLTIDTIENNDLNDLIVIQDVEVNHSKSSYLILTYKIKMLLFKIIMMKILLMMTKMILYHHNHHKLLIFQLLMLMLKMEVMA